MDTKKIFLTSIAELRDKSTIDYFVCDEDVEFGTYTTAMSITEAGIKYIISKYDIDEIIVLGPGHCASSEEKSSTKISNIHVKNIENLNSVSEYGFLCYRITEFLKKLDIEYADTAELIDDNTKESIKVILQDFKAKNGIVGDREIFYKLSVDRELYKKFKEEVLNARDQNERRWIQHYLYSLMDSYYKMHIKDNNKDATIRFIDINDKDLLTIDTITKIVNEVLNENSKTIELYMDSQGLTPTDGNILLSTFLMANRKIGYNCEIKGLINTKRVSNAFAGHISDAYASYHAQKLVEAIDLFLDYGKDTALKEYWNALQAKHDTIDALFASMDCIDEGIALCNIDLIIYGMRFIKKVIDNYLAKGDKDSIYLDFIVNSIRSDYGDILIKDDIRVCDLLKWTLKKGFYQQTLTIVESKIPEDMVARGIYYYAKDENDVNDYLKKLNVLYWTEQRKSRWAFNDVDHYFIKTYGRTEIDNRQKPEMIAMDLATFKVNALKGVRENVAKAYSNLNNDKLLFDVFHEYYKLGTLRNHINHAEFLEKDLDEKIILERKDTRDEIRTELEKFIIVYEKAYNEVELSTKPVIITSQKFRWYTKNHELKLFEENTDLTKKNTYTCEFNGKEVKIDITLFKNDENSER